jgi:hypothetical protein
MIGAAALARARVGRRTCACIGPAPIIGPMPRCHHRRKERQMAVLIVDMLQPSGDVRAQRLNLSARVLETAVFGRFSAMPRAFARVCISSQISIGSMPM